jgi:hypothetical protein
MYGIRKGYKEKTIVNLTPSLNLNLLKGLDYA